MFGIHRRNRRNNSRNTQTQQQRLPPPWRRRPASDGPCNPTILFLSFSSSSPYPTITQSLQLSLRSEKEQSATTLWIPTRFSELRRASWLPSVGLVPSFHFILIFIFKFERLDANPISPFLQPSPPPPPWRFRRDVVIVVSSLSIGKPIDFSLSPVQLLLCFHESKS